MITIRRLKPHEDDLAISLMKLWYPDRIHSHKQLQSMLSDDSNVIIIIEKEGQIIGGATAYKLDMYTRDTTELFIYEIGIDLPHRGQGYGTKLMNYLLNIAKNEECKEAFVITEKGNISANKLYKATGGINEECQCYSYSL